MCVDVMGLVVGSIGSSSASFCSTCRISWATSWEISGLVLGAGVFCLAEEEEEPGAGDVEGVVVFWRGDVLAGCSVWCY